MPEEEGEDQANAKSHKPGHVEEGAVAKVGESAKDRQPLWKLPGGLGKNSALKQKNQMLTHICLKFLPS